MESIDRLPLALYCLMNNLVGLWVQPQLTLENATPVQQIPQPEHIVVVDHNQHPAGFMQRKV